MQLAIALLLVLLAAPAVAQMPTHPPINAPSILATGEIPAAARSAVSADMLERVKRGVPEAARAAYELHRARAINPVEGKKK